LRAGLDHDGVWLEFLDELLRTLGKHCGLVAGANQEHFLAIEALSQVDQRVREHAVSVAHALVGTGFDVRSALEHVDWEGGGTLGPHHAVVERAVAVLSDRH